MAAVVYSASSLDNLEQVVQRVPEESIDAKRAALLAIRTAVEHLAAHPLVGRRVEDNLRELVISCGKTGYLALYRFNVSRDEVRILALRHQRDLGFVP